MTKLALNPAKEIVHLHEKIGDAYRTSLDNALRIGELLTEQKKALPHGKFLPWVEENLPFNRKTAAKYMKVYAHRGEVKCLTRETFAEALRVLGPKKKRPSRPKPEPETPPEEPVVLDVEGVEVPEPEPPDPKLEKISNLTDVYKLGSKPEPPTPEPDRGPPIITTDEIFREASPEVEDDFPVYEGKTAAEVLAKSGLPKPMNWGVAPIAQMTRKEAEARRPGYKWPEGSRDTHEDFEAFVEQDSGPSDPERDALPDEWIGPLYKLLEAGHGDAVGIVLGKLLKKFDLGD